MADYGKYDKNGKGMNFEQFRSKLDNDDVKKNENLKKFFGIFDTENRNGILDTDAEQNSLFAKACEYDKDGNGTLDDSEIANLLASEPDMQAIKDDKNVFDAIKNFFSSFNTNIDETESKADNTSAQNKKIIKNDDGSSTILEITPMGIASTTINNGKIESYALYDGYNLDDFENNKLNKVYEGSISSNGVREEIVYDNAGNTSEKYIQIVVNEGDTLSSIAKLCNTSVDAIKEYNKIGNNSSLKLGQSLIIPVETSFNTAKLKSRPSVSDDYSKRLEQALKNVYSSPIKTEKLDNASFKTIEEAAKYVLTSLNNKKDPTKKEILICAKELMFLNGNGDDIFSLTKSALKKINSGELTYLGNNTYEKNLLIACGFTESADNAEFYQRYYATMDALLENTSDLNIYTSLMQLGKTIDNCYKKGIKDPEKIKSAILRECGINLFDEKDADKAQNQIYQDFCVNILASIAQMRVSNKEGVQTSLLATLSDDIANLVNLLGGSLTSTQDLVDLYKENLDFYKSLSSENMKFEDFEKVFKVIFKQVLDPKKLDEFIKLCQKPDISFKDKEFKEKFKEVFNSDFLKECLKENTIDNIFTSAFNIVLTLTLLKGFSNTKEMQTLMTNTQDVLKNTLNLSDKLTKLVLSMTAGAATMGATTLTGETLLAILKQDPTLAENIPKDVLASAGFGATAGAINTILIEPLCTGKSVETVYKALDKIITKQVSLAEFSIMFEKAANPLIKSGAMRMAYSTIVNTAGFTAYNMAGDIIDDLFISKEGKIAEYGVGKYIGQSFWSNLKGVLSFEGVSALISFIATGKIAASKASELTSMKDVVDCYSLINQCTIEPNPNCAEGQAKTYILRSSNGQTMTVTAQQAFTYTAFLMQV